MEGGSERGLREGLRGEGGRGIERRWRERD